MSNTQENAITIKRMINGQRYAAMPLAFGGAIITVALTAVATLMTVFSGLFLMFIIPVVAFSIFGGMLLSFMKENIDRETRDFSFDASPKFTKTEICKMLLHVPFNKSVNCGSTTLYDGAKDLPNYYDDFDAYHDSYDVRSGQIDRSVTMVNNRVVMRSITTQDTSYLWESAFARNSKGYLG